MLSPEGVHVPVRVGTAHGAVGWPDVVWFGGVEFDCLWSTHTKVDYRAGEERLARLEPALLVFAETSSEDYRETLKWGQVRPRGGGT